MNRILLVCTDLRLAPASWGTVSARACAPNQHAQYVQAA
jgi:hypothetical protein